MASNSRTIGDFVRAFLVVAGIALLTFVPASHAVALDLFYPFGTENGDTVMQPGDDISTNDIFLPTPVVLYNQTYRTLYVNVNGMISFGSEMPDYRAERPFPLEIEDVGLIAVFLADVDTSRAGRVFYRSTNDSAMVQRAAADIQTYFSGFEDFLPSSLFIATWDRVGYYDGQSDMTNTFQLVLVSDGQNSFSLFHYQDGGIEWTMSQGKLQAPYNDRPPQAGFDGGMGKKSFTLPGSGRNQDFVEGSNVDVAGVWMFQIGNVGSKNVRSADLNTGDVTLFEVETHNNCFNAGNVCDRNAQCVDHEDSFCCRCVQPFYGNGKKCLEPKKPQVVNGRITGTVNGITLSDDIQMHTYVVTTDGRTYTAISRVPDNLAGVMQTLTSVGGIVGWLFSVKINPRAKNGFEFTGGIFNRTARVTYTSQDGRTYVLRINQVAYGHTPQSGDHMRMDTYLEGSLPEIAHTNRIKVEDYHENFKRTAPGTIKSFVERKYRVQDVAYKYTWDNTITFDECGAEDLLPATGAVMRLSVSKHFSSVAKDNMVVRFAMKSHLGVYSGSDPCANADQLCDEHADCRPLEGSYKCVCMPGYTGDGVTCNDINECQQNPCDPNAICYNVDGTFQCQCRRGYDGDGRICTATPQCGRDRCDPNARCVRTDEGSDEVRCACNPGYRGDGITCAVAERTCNEVDICSENAQCIYDDDLQQYMCECLDEFSGDGYTCEAMRDYSSCEACDRYALCLLDEVTNRYRCECRPGFTGDGRRCDVIERCRQCDRYARCVFDEEVGDYECVCGRGYKGDGLTCELRDCREDETMCHPEGGLCWFDANRNISICRCNYGYRGDGFNCERVGCDLYNDCDRNAQCDTSGERAECRCNEGYEGDGRRCRPVSQDQGCNVVNNCDNNARCIPVAGGRYECRCVSGYRGDGRRCYPEPPEPTESPGCNVVRDCDSNARCMLVAEDTFECRCNPGYRGDGKVCQPEETGCNVRNNCDGNARCIPVAGGRYECRCNQGYRGDGLRCEPEVLPCNQVNNCDRNAECLYNPDVAAYQCRCARGYEGDGLYCRRKEIIDCRSDPRLCGRDAECVQGAEEAFVCVCRPGYRGDGATCSPVVQEGNYLIYAQGTKIMRISADREADDHGRILAYEPDMLAVGVEVDCQEGEVYWTDAAKGIIKKAKLNGTGVENIINNMKSPEGIAIDFVARNMFFTDSEMDSLHVSKLNGSDMKMLVNTEMVNPRAIVLDVNKGVIYWTDWNRNRPQIERINMDGTDRRILVRDDLRLPNGLAYDSFSESLCWGDAGTSRIECIRSDGVDRRVVYGEASYPFDIALLNNVIYWTDWRMREIPNVNQNGGDANPSLKQAVGGHGRVYGIAAVRERCPRARNSCGLNNGGCKYLCLPTENGGRTCECPDGLDPRVCQN